MNHDQVLKLMKKVYRYQAANQVRWVKRRTGKIRFIKDTDWERGVFWSSVAAAWETTRDQEYLDGVMNYALHTGFRTGPQPRFADDLVCSQAYLSIYPEIAISEALDSTTDFVKNMVDNPKPGREDWWWCDSLFMAPPAFVHLAKVLKQPEIAEYANQAWWDSVEHLFDPETNLVFRDYRYIPNDAKTELREDNGEKVFWARGVGWVLAAIPRVLAHLPQNHIDRQRYLDLFTKIACSVTKYQHEDGFWRCSLLNPQAFPNPESSATALFCYGLAWGLNNQILEQEVYLPVVQKAWKALESAVHPNGMLGWVQLPAFNPRDVKFEHNIDYGTGAFLLAGTEILKLSSR